MFRLPGRSHHQRPVARGVPREKMAVPSREEDEDLPTQRERHSEPRASVRDDWPSARTGRVTITWQ